MQAFFHKVRGLLTQNSHLTPYLPFAREDPTHKLIRLIADKSGDPNSTTTAKARSISKLKSSVASASLPKTSGQLCLNPMNDWLMLWYSVVFVGIIYYFSETTIILTYGEVAWQAALSSPAFITLNVFFILVFIGDIYVQFNTGYITNSAIILDRARVTYRYTHYYFYFDVLVVVIFTISVIIRVLNFNYAKLIIFYKFMRLFEFNVIYLRKLATNVVARTAFEISKQFVTIFVLSHIIGLIFYVIDFTLTNYPICEGNNQSFCWLYSSTAYSPIIQLDWTLQYFYSLYWGVNTICQISYGDIAPNNPVETPYAVLCMCFGSIMYTYIVNNIVKAIIWANENRDKFRVDLVIFDLYMDKLRIKQEDQYEIVNFLKERYREQTNRNLVLEDLMKSKLPEQLKIDLVRNAYNHFVQGLEYFIGEDIHVINLLNYLREKKYGLNEQIISQGAPLKQLCFMVKGEVVLSCAFHRLNYGIVTLNMPDTFIAAYEFFINQRSSYSVLSKKNTVIYFISQQFFDEEVEEQLDFKQAYKLLSYDLFIKRKFERIFYSCFFCDNNHHWHQCPTVFPKFEEAILLNNQKDDKQSGVRVVNIKHRSYRDYPKLRQLTRIVLRSKDKVLSQLQNRLFVLKKRLEVDQEMFQVDCAYDWPSYQVQQNISCLKEKWNKKFPRKRSQII